LVLIEKSGRIKSMPFLPAGTPLLYFFPLLDIAPFVLLKVSSRVWGRVIVFGQWF
jgi:hypothetical protein